ncbi:MAG TPA: SEC-C metal-binding domain-containing protein [Byssovorax sp.]|jgi:hypothetical protein
MWLSVVEALQLPHPCACDCFHTLPLAERTRSVAAMYRFDDALRGWGYEPVYELAGDRIYRIAQAKNDPAFRVIPVRDSACIYRRLVGFAVHEVIHAALGDTSLANYGIPWGAPYAVPDDTPRGLEADALAPLNRAEAMAFVGVGPVAEALFGVDWPVYTARDVGTYGFAGGNAIVAAPPGFRAVPHVDRVHHAARYYELARALEVDAERALTAAKVDQICAAFTAAERAFAARAPRRRPPPADIARIAPRAPGRNDLCACGSGKKAKRCCAA